MASGNVAVTEDEADEPSHVGGHLGSVRQGYERANVGGLHRPDNQVTFAQLV
jgi:hypothetical protein